MVNGGHDGGQLRHSRKAREENRYDRPEKFFFRQTSWTDAAGRAGRLPPAPRRGQSGHRNEQPRPRAVLIRDVAVWDGESEQAFPTRTY